MNQFGDAKYRRKIGGIKAKAFGQMFEQIFHMNCNRLKIAVTPIPDSCKQLSQKKLIRIKSPFDWVLTYKGRSAVIDTKTTMNSFCRSDITVHQVRELLSHEVAGGIGGYIIWYRDVDSVLFIPASILDLHLKTNKPGSLSSYPNVINLGKIQEFQLLRIFDTKD